MWTIIVKPLVASQVIIDTGFHVLERVKGGKHVDELGQR